MTSTRQLVQLVATLALVCALASQTVQAGCPFDDGSCQEYCSQQGCNLGYCGHFAWIQCICRKCGDEWNWYDKVHYNPDKQVNQTELDSLKLNGSAPLILTNNNAKRVQSSEEKVAVAGSQQQVLSSAGQQQTAKAATTQQQQATQAPAKQQEQKMAATLTTLLIPDLSDGSKLDLNDIPDDENSEKFLDYLTKNHEKLVQATNKAQQRLAINGGTSARSSAQDGDNEGKDDDADNDDTDADQQQATPANKGGSDDDSQAEEAIEIQISSSNNNNNNNQAPVEQTTTMTTTTTTTTTNKSGGAGRSAASDDDGAESNGESRPSMTRLLRMAVAERSPDDIL